MKTQKIDFTQITASNWQRTSFHSLHSHSFTYSLRRDLVITHFVPVCIYLDFGNEYLSIKKHRIYI